VREGVYAMTTGTDEDIIADERWSTDRDGARPGRAG
jgi:hypothetical protein